MLRQLHSIPGLIAAALLIVVTLTGAALSIQPALERAAVAGGPRRAAAEPERRTGAPNSGAESRSRSAPRP